MPTTHGGKSIHFEWKFENDALLIQNKNGRTHEFHLKEIYKILEWLWGEFGTKYFPLVINVAKMGDGSEQNGLGTAILRQAPKDIDHAQGSSYLGVVLEQVRILEWNGAIKGIRWRMPWPVKSLRDLRHALSIPQG